MPNEINLSEKDAARFWSKVNKDGPLWTDPQTGESSPCWEWRGTMHHSGYGIFKIKRKMCPAHRVALVYSIGELPEGTNALHSCDNRPCCNPSHLRAGTPSENAADRDSRGRANVAFGERHWNAKVTAEQVSEIIELRKQGVLLQTIGDRYDLSDAQVSNIARGGNRRKG